MEIKKIEVYIIIDEGASPKYIKTMKGDDGESLDDIKCAKKKISF
jgi:hypothetical protein